MILEVTSEQAMKDIGKQIGMLLHGGEVFELIGDVGAGKTTFVKGLALGLGVTEDVQSPSFTISRIYEARDNLQLMHYDFYRLSEPGILAREIQEVVTDPHAIIVIEWADIVEGVLPEHRFTLRFHSPSDMTRKIDIPEQLESKV